MNKRGQTLILFIILIPILLVVLGLVVDMGIVFSNKVRVRDVTKDVIEECFTKELDDDKIKEIFVNNKIDVDNLEVIKNSDSVRIKNLVKVESMFGSIIGLREYEIKIDITGFRNDNKIDFKY